MYCVYRKTRQPSDKKTHQSVPNKTAGTTGSPRVAWKDFFVSLCALALAMHFLTWLQKKKKLHFIYVFIWGGVFFSFFFFLSSPPPPPSGPHFLFHFHQKKFFFFFFFFPPKSYLFTYSFPHFSAPEQEAWLVLKTRQPTQDGEKKRKEEKRKKKKKKTNTHTPQPRWLGWTDQKKKKKKVSEQLSEGEKSPSCSLQ